MTMMVAVKVLYDNADDFKQEVVVSRGSLQWLTFSVKVTHMKRLKNHRNIVAFCGVSEIDGRLALITEVRGEISHSH
jgi:hypothetical protein